MGILLAFAPFLAFVVVDRLGATEPALACGLLVSIFLVGRDLLLLHGKPKILESGTVILFGALLIYSFITGATLSVIAVRLCVDTGLLLIVLISMLLRRPFTLQYAKQQVAPEVWNRPEFIRTNDVITAAWALAFAAMVAAEAALLDVPQLPRKAGVAVIILAIVAARKFTSWYPEQQRQLPRHTPES